MWELKIQLCWSEMKIRAQDLHTKVTCFIHNCRYCGHPRKLSLFRTFFIYVCKKSIKFCGCLCNKKNNKSIVCHVISVETFISSFHNSSTFNLIRSIVSEKLYISYNIFCIQTSVRVYNSFYKDVWKSSFSSKATVIVCVY